MNLKYKILLFEDDESYVESLRRLLSLELGTLGFELTLEHYPGEPANLPDKLGKSKWDLILMDYYLKSGSKRGDKILPAIRSSGVLTNIIYYSEHPNFKEEISKEELEGVYTCRGRTNLPQKVKQIIEVTLKQHLDVNHLRGLIIAETIDLVHQMDEIILSNIKMDVNDQIFVKEKILGEEFFTDYQKYRIIKRIFDKEIDRLNRSLEKTTEQIEIDKINSKSKQLTQLKESFSKLENEIIQIRNHMAHAKCIDENNNILMCRKNGQVKPDTFDEKRCISIRKDFLKHSKNLDTINTALSNI